MKYRGVCSKMKVYELKKVKYMSFWKRLFGMGESVQQVESFLQYLESIEKLLKPVINPVKHQYKEGFFRNDFTFIVSKDYTREEMQRLTWLESVKCVKRKQGSYVWKAPIRELRAIQALEKPKFAELYITPVVERLYDAPYDLEELDSVLEFEETVKNVYEAMQASEGKAGSEAVWDKSQQLLKRVSLEIQQELQQLELSETTAHLEHLIIEEKYVNRHKK